MEENHSLRLDRQRLEALMEMRGVSGASLARSIGVGAGTIQKIKSREATTLGRIAQLSRVLNCSPFDLLVAEGFPEPFSGAPASH